MDEKFSDQGCADWLRAVSGGGGSAEMRIALCSTTIHIPHVLTLLQQYGPEYKAFIACDRSTPIDANIFCDGMPNAWAIHADQQSEWKCSEALGWNTLARRNIAFLEALKGGAELIYSWDNDNIPLTSHHFAQLHDITNRWFYGIQFTSPGGWFDPGTLLIPQTRHRGFPHDKTSTKMAVPIANAKVGVAAGLIVGDPDIDASTRIERHPDIAQLHILATGGVVLDPLTWTVFNSQNTAIVRELVPAWFMMPGVGRHDDIYASLIVQRVARERGYHVHFGLPFCYQQRNQHNLVADLRAELAGMENVATLAYLIDHIQLLGTDIVADTRRIYETLRGVDFIPEQAVDAAMLWLEDCEEVL